MAAARASPYRIFGIWFCIICVIFGAYHLINFVNPLLGLGSSLGGSGSGSGDSISPTSFPSNGDDLTADQFADMVVYYQDYEWESYDSEDFPDWLYMPDNWTYSNDSSTPQPFEGYDWTNYNANDFPSWLDMPATLPEDFDADQFDIMEYMDESYRQEVMVAMSSSDTDSSDLALLQLLMGQSDSGSDSGSGFDMSQIFGLLAGSDLIRSILFFMASLILFILLRTTH